MLGLFVYVTICQCICFKVRMNNLEKAGCCISWSANERGCRGAPGANAATGVMEVLQQAGYPLAHALLAG